MDDIHHERTFLPSGPAPQEKPLTATKILDKGANGIYTFRQKKYKIINSEV